MPPPPKPSEKRDLAIRAPPPLKCRGHGVELGLVSELETELGVCLGMSCINCMGWFGGTERITASAHCAFEQG